MTRSKLLNLAMAGVFAASTLGLVGAAMAKENDSKTNEPAILANAKVTMSQAIATAENKVGGKAVGTGDVRLPGRHQRVERTGDLQPAILGEQDRVAGAAPCPLGKCCARGRIVDTPFGPLCTGGRRYGDSWNFVLGFDHNQFIRWLNPSQSIFFTTQFFYKHLNGAAPRTRQGIELQNKRVFKGEVLPVPSFNVAAPFLPSAGASQSVLIHNPVDQYLNTLLITTSYFSSQINPALTLFYDWSGSFVAQPQIVLSRDPFRFTFAYSFLTAGTLKGASGVSLLRDRDNVLFQLDYVI